MKLIEAAEKGIRRVRRSGWANDKAYLLINIINGGIGPWGHLYDRDTQSAIGETTPQNILLIQDSTDDFIEYIGDTDTDDNG